MTIPPQERSVEEIIDDLKNGQADVFQTIRLLDDKSALCEVARKSGGVVYTPRHIADFMLSLLDVDEGTILEPSCGRGVFVFALAERVLKTRGPSAVADLASRLTCAELDPAASRDLALLWEAWCSNKGITSPTPEIVVGDTLFSSFDMRRFTHVIGNPPYVRFQNLPSEYRDKLKGKFASCDKGNVDIYHAFIELALSVGENVCFIVPNSWMATRSGAKLRAMIRPRLSTLIDFGDELVFAPVRAYSSIIHCEVGAPAELLLSLGIPDKPSAVSNSADLLSEPRWTVNAYETSKAPPLSDKITAYSGIATLADSAFRIDGTSCRNGMVTFLGGPDGKKVMNVPEAFAPKIFKMTKISSEEDMLSSVTRILYPYDENGKLLDEETLTLKAPDLLLHLSWQRDRLLSRDGGDTSKHEAWYAYGRKQGLSQLPKDRLVALSGMSRNGLSPFVFDSRKVGKFLFTSGFVIAAKPGVTNDEILKTLASDEMWDWILIHGKEWASAKKEDKYRSYGTRLLLSAPWGSK